MSKESLLFERWPRFAYRHARLVLLGTLVALAVLASLWGSLRGDFGGTFSIPGSESQELFDLFEERFPATAGDSSYVVVRSADGVVDAETRARVDRLIGEIEKLPEVYAVTSPYETIGAISEDSTVARIDVRYAGQTNEIKPASAEALIALAEGATSEELQVEAGGPVTQVAERQASGSSEIIGISAAVVILLIAFGSVVAMALPILTALLGLSSGFFIVGLATSVVGMPNWTTQFVAMIGIGVGIDYALLISTRFREARSQDLSSEDAAVLAAATAGRSVFFAGGTVVIALLGLWASGIASIGWVGTAAAMVVATTVAIAVLVMPAILRYAGPVINSLQIPFLAAPAAEAETGIGYRLSRLVQRRPVVCLVVTAGILLLLTAPVLDLRLGISDPGNNPESFTSRRAYDLISEGFGPGTNGPIVVGFRIDDPGATGQVGQASDFLAAIDGVDHVGPVTFNDDESAAVVTVIPESAPQDAATVTLIHDLRSALQEEYADSGAKPLVGGSTATFIDVGEQLSDRLPYFLGAVIGLSFLLLIVVFRSILVPLKAALMNLISIGASFGVLVMIFQWGWFGIAREGPVEAFLPMMLFAVLFGLSMDYEVFLVTRIREEYDASGDNTEAVARGLSVTTRVISAAAAIMVAVFLTFAFSDHRVVKEFGIGLGFAVFLDATLVRLILVPSLMQLAGRWNWWLPSWLDRLIPHVSIHGRLTRSPQPVAPGRD
ncbi:MAG: MMPL family transporter [Chloroflexi bacterium]|nr:MAG: MMPL family transporter [Chloroflexota bacterium]